MVNIDVIPVLIYGAYIPFEEEDNKQKYKCSGEITARDKSYARIK